VLLSAAERREKREQRQAVQEGQKEVQGGNIAADKVI
jgi:hypothetical protein